jgi:hypothetical protein
MNELSFIYLNRYHCEGPKSTDFGTTQPIIPRGEPLESSSVSLAPHFGLKFEDRVDKDAQDW